jgi:hypothetical protein
MAELSPKEIEFVKLAANWGKGMSPKQLRVWAERAEGYDLAIIRIAVNAAIDDSQRKRMPDGWAEFAQYLPVQVQKESTRGWYGIDGQWGGNWERSSKASMLSAAAHMLREGPIHTERFHAFTHLLARRGIDFSLVEEGARQNPFSVTEWAKAQFPEG